MWGRMLGPMWGQFHCSIGKPVLSVSCARFKSHICKLRPPPPTLGPRNPCICPCLSRTRRSTQIPDCAHFLLVGKRSERLCRRLVMILFDVKDYRLLYGFGENIHMTFNIFANVHQLMFLVLKLVWIRIEYSLV